MCLHYKSFEKKKKKTVRKGEIARNEQYLLYPLCFLPLRRVFYHLHNILNFRLQTFQFGRVLRFFVWERVNPLPDMPILGSSSSAANKNIMSKTWTNRDPII